MKIMIDETQNGYTVTIRENIFNVKTYSFESSQQMLELLKKILEQVDIYKTAKASTLTRPVLP